MSFFFLLLRYTKRKPKGFRYCIKPAKCGSLPSPGSAQGNYVFEAMLDEIAEKLNIDPWELRLRNALPLNKPTIYGAKSERREFRNVSTPFAITQMLKSNWG